MRDSRLFPSVSMPAACVAALAAVVLLAGCRPKPARITIEAPELLHDLRPHPIAARVLDDKGGVMPLVPALSLAPAGTAKLDEKGQLTCEQSGDVEIVASAGEGPAALSARHKLRCRILTRWFLPSEILLAVEDGLTDAGHAAVSERGRRHADYRPSLALVDPANDVVALEGDRLRPKKPGRTKLRATLVGPETVAEVIVVKQRAEGRHTLPAGGEVRLPLEPGVHRINAMQQSILAQHGFLLRWSEPACKPGEEARQHIADCTLIAPGWVALADADAKNTTPIEVSFTRWELP